MDKVDGIGDCSCMLSTEQTAHNAVILRTESLCLFKVQISNTELNTCFVTSVKLS